MTTVSALLLGILIGMAIIVFASEIAEIVELHKREQQRKQYQSLWRMTAYDDPQFLTDNNYDQSIQDIIKIQHENQLLLHDYGHAHSKREKREALLRSLKMPPWPKVDLPSFINKENDK
jgi:hypothetical protein